MNHIEISISLETDDPTDIKYQNELHDIKKSLESHNPKLELLKIKAKEPERTAKSPEMEAIVGSIRLALPAGALITILSSFIKSYFEARKSRTILIKKKGGNTIRITGYSETETQRLLKKILEKNK